MSKPCEAVDRAAVDVRVLGGELWDAIVQLSVEWSNAIRSKDHAAAARAEQELRFFVLAFASLVPDDAAVTTGRKAILRSLYGELGMAHTAHVAAMLSCVIAREEAAARPLAAQHSAAGGHP